MDSYGFHMFSSRASWLCLTDVQICTVYTIISNNDEELPKIVQKKILRYVDSSI